MLKLWVVPSFSTLVMVSEPSEPLVISPWLSMLLRMFSRLMTSGIRCCITVIIIASPASLGSIPGTLRRALAACMLIFPSACTIPDISLSVILISRLTSRPAALVTLFSSIGPCFSVRLVPPAMRCPPVLSAIICPCLSMVTDFSCLRRNSPERS